MDPIAMLVVAVVCIVIGYVAGTLLNSPRDDKKNVADPPELPPDTLIAGRLEVARFLRDKPGSPVQVVVDGKLISHPDALSLGQRDHLEALLLELRTWLGYPAVPSQAAAAAVSSEPVLAQPFTAAVTTSAAPGIDGGILPATPPFTQAKSIVGQIDDILQEHLTTSPYANKSIRLIESPNKGVLVAVGLEQYPGIDEVPDASIRTLIREAVSEWELKAK
ncbi:MAG: hypothetical protein PHQ40_11320 [Anaerolineaceae bacterium]|nr:hypothetical protein [Anaerolineaceae bacterium]